MMAAMLSENRIINFKSTWSGRFVESTLAHGVLCVVALLAATKVNAVTLDNMSYTSLPGDRVQVRLQLSQPVGADPLSFTIDNPARVAIDFPGTSLNMDQR